MTVTNGIYNHNDADRQAIIESMAQVYHISLAEATARYNEGDWQGFNSTAATQEVEREADTLAPASALSVPAGREGDVEGAETAPQTNVPAGVTPQQIVQGPQDDEDGFEEMSEERRRAISPTNRRSFVKTDEFDPEHPLDDEEVNKTVKPKSQSSRKPTK